MKRFMLIASILICGLLTVQTPAMAERHYTDNGLPCREAYFPSEDSLEASKNLNQPPTIRIDGKYLVTDVDPAIINGRTLLPLRAAGEALDATVTWEQSTRTATAVKGNRTVVFTLGSKYYTVNGQKFMADIAPTALNGRTLLPLRAFSEAFKAEVVWNQELYNITIDTPAADAPSAVIPAGTNSDAEKFIKKYYVAPSSADKYVGSFKKTLTGNGTVTDQYLFISPYQDKYHCVEVRVENSPSLTTNIVTVMRDEAIYFFDEAEQFESMLVYYNQHPTYYRGPARGWTLEYINMYTFIAGGFYEVGQIELPSEQLIEPTNFDPFVRF